MFTTNPNKTGNDPDDALFQAYDESAGKVMDGVFWPVGLEKPVRARRRRKRDGDWCAEVVERYLAAKAGEGRQHCSGSLARALRQRQSRPVDVNGLRALDVAEHSFVEKSDCIGSSSFSQSEMLKYIEQGSMKCLAGFSLTHAPISVFPATLRSSDFLEI